MALIKFERVTAPAGSIEFSVNPTEHGYGGEREYLQPSGRSDGGLFYCFDKGVNPEELRTMAWDYLPLADFNNLLAFINIVRGRDFNFRDFDGNFYRAVFLEPDEKIIYKTGEHGIAVVDLIIKEALPILGTEGAAPILTESGEFLGV